MTASVDEQQNVSTFCGWGRVMFGQTFDDPADIAAKLRVEAPGQRDIAAYVTEPHVVLSYAPQQLFLDPSDMLRLHLATLEEPEKSSFYEVRRPQHAEEAQAINDLYIKRGMVPTDVDFVSAQDKSSDVVFLIAIDRSNRRVLGTVMGLNHMKIFGDATKGSSLWCLAVDPAAAIPGVGESLVCHLAYYFKQSGCEYMDLSVIYDNHQAKALYKKLGFEKVQVFAIKTKNAHNENLFMGPEVKDGLNPYAQLIVDEARTRGISAEVLDSDEGYFCLSRGGKSITCRESLSDLTSAVAMSRCQDKYVTHRWLTKGGLKVPDFRLASDAAANNGFFAQHGRIVVKPSTGEQGKGISVVYEQDQLEQAIEKARRYADRVLLESFHPGNDLRVIVINTEVVAAAIRRPASIIGDGKHAAKVLIEKQSRRRSAATQGESRIPMDDDTIKCLKQAGYELDDVIPVGEEVTVRSTANLHTGGTIQDVTNELHPALADVCIKAAQFLEIPVVGLDLIVESATKPEYVIIEANERPGLANHEPQPTAQRFIDILFPLSFSATEHSPA